MKATNPYVNLPFDLMMSALSSMIIVYKGDISD